MSNTPSPARQSQGRVQHGSILSGNLCPPGSLLSGNQRIEATYVKVRQNERIVSVAVIIAVGVNSDGRREVLGMDIGPSEAESFWTAFLRKLMRRGLRGVKLVISEGGGKPSCCVPPGNAATCTSCAMRWPMPARAAGASSPPSSPPPSRGKPPRLPAGSGDPWPIRCGPNSPSWQPCWMRRSPMYWPTWRSPRNTGSSCTARMRWKRPVPQKCAIQVVRGRLRGEERNPGCEFRQAALS